VTNRNNDGTFAKGASGNTGGRTTGSGVTGQLRKAILEKSPELLQMVIDKALTEGDVAAATALLNKVIPNLKAANEPVKFELDTSKSISGVGAEIVGAISQGDIALDSGTQLLSSLASLAKLQEMDDLSKRIEALEQEAQKA